MATTDAAATDVLFCCPLPFEVWAVAAAHWRREGLARPRIARTGMGPTNAAATAARLRFDADGSAAEDRGPGEGAAGAEVVAGVAGALNRSLHLGDVVVADRVLDADGRAVGAALPSVAALAEALTQVGLTVQVGPIITVDRLASSPEQRARLAAMGAVAVDMESAPLVAAASPRRVAVVRAISDVAEHSVFHPSIIRGGVLALRSLRRAAPVAARWGASPA
jgi:4-hydroxy-3-methylbut-2-en-1-yl diphosphate reductase